MDVQIIGIAGGSGSGKTYFAETLAEKLGSEKSFVLYQDNYYRDQSAKFDFDGGSVNFDHPDAIDFELLSQHLAELKKGHSIQIPLYDFATHSRRDETIHQEPKKVVILDGILVLSQEILHPHYDYTVFVETPEDVRYERRLKRDIEERGRKEEGVYNQFHKQVKPMHDQFVEPSKKHAQLISSGTCPEDFSANIEHLVSQLI